MSQKCILSTRCESAGTLEAANNVIGSEATLHHFAPLLAYGPIASLAAYSLSLKHLATRLFFSPADSIIESM